jgi:hypothetical protein
MNPEETMQGDYANLESRLSMNTFCIFPKFQGTYRHHYNALTEFLLDKRMTELLVKM